MGVASLIGQSVGDMFHGSHGFANRIASGSSKGCKTHRQDLVPGWHFFCSVVLYRFDMVDIFLVRFQHGPIFCWLLSARQTGPPAVDGGFHGRCRGDFGTLGGRARVLAVDGQRAVGLAQARGDPPQAPQDRLDIPVDVAGAQPIGAGALTASSYCGLRLKRMADGLAPVSAVSSVVS